MKDKRGAIELSITTIVVVVIGITILTLALIWVGGIFDKLGGTTQGAFEKVDTEIEAILGGSTGDFISLSPSQITLKKGKTARAKIILANIDQDQLDRSLKATRLGQPINIRDGSRTNEINCVFGDTGTTPSSDYLLSSGFQAEITILVIEKGAGLGTYLCNFEVTSSPLFTENFDTQITLQIDVVK